MVDFHALRHDSAHHLGLGDVRLTVAQQEEIENALRCCRALVSAAKHYFGSYPGDPMEAPSCEEDANANLVWDCEMALGPPIVLGLPMLP